MEKACKEQPNAIPITHEDWLLMKEPVFIWIEQVTDVRHWVSTVQKDLG